MAEYKQARVRQGYVLVKLVIVALYVTFYFLKATCELGLLQFWRGTICFELQ